MSYKKNEPSKIYSYKTPFSMYTEDDSEEEDTDVSSNERLSIVIGDFKFTLIYKTATYETGKYAPQYNNPDNVSKISDIIKIKTINERDGSQYIFWVYSSMSELGIWRFLCYDSYQEAYVKGIDYVQSSCINILLQKHIYLCYNMLDTIVLPHKDFIEQRTRPAAYTPNYGIFSQITKQIVKQKYDVSKCTSILNDEKRKINEIAKIFEVDDIPKCGRRNSEEKIIQQIEYISEYLKSEYIIESHEELFRYNYLFQDIINSENIVIQVNLKHKTTNEEIILFYKKMFFTKIQDKEYELEYKANIDIITSEGNVHYSPFLLIPKTSECMYNSLYTKYIDMGIYICKPFEYNRAVFTSNPITCTDDYTYVSNRYQNIFPINIIERKGGKQQKYKANKANKTNRKRKRKKKKTIKRSKRY